MSILPRQMASTSEYLFGAVTELRWRDLRRRSYGRLRAVFIFQAGVTLGVRTPKSPKDGRHDAEKRRGIALMSRVRTSVWRRSAGWAFLRSVGPDVSRNYMNLHNY